VEGRDAETERDLLLLCRRDDGLLTDDEEAELARRLRDNPQTRRLMYEHYAVANELGALLSGRAWGLRPSVRARRRRAQVAVGVALVASVAFAAALHRRRAPAPTSVERAVVAGTAERAAAEARRVPRLTPAPAPAPSSEPVVRVDFEEGAALANASVSRGAVVPCPEGARGRQCLMGGLNFEERKWERYTASVHLAPTLRVPYRPGMLLTFTYWADEGVREIGVRLWVEATRAHHSTVIPAISGRWTQAQVPLADLAPVPPATAPLAPGDLVEYLHVTTHRTERKLFYIDDIEIR
jgi:hypothetical protein